ncbi:pyridoxal-phosphate dependent enzyme [Plantactinospora sp. GCM10030261]|uniref:pyridoxal-phosphate dependent enzyme n=1 Tax=Plantactinospora sp. GCM10030261 TaxID=3273420 RepID=UPI00361CDF2D
MDGTSMNGTARLAGLRCPRCGHRTSPDDLTFFRGCPVCAKDNVPVNYACDLPADQVTEALHRARADRPGLWRWGDALPVAPDRPVSLGEGGTPLLPVPGLGSRLGHPRLYVKNESANPTWSHKDRLAALTVAAAAEVGATTVTAASTGNHGAALAAYAARAGLRCVIFTLASVPETMKTLMLAYGADVIAVPTSEDRYTLLAEGVERHGWYPGSNAVAPPVGSPPHGVDGYKTIAYEVFEQLGRAAPDVLVLPVAYGDCLAGVRRGFADLHTAGLIDRPPRLVGAEVFAALTGALARDTEDGPSLGPVGMRPTAAFSIAGAYATRQSVRAVRDTHGRAVNVDESALLRAQRALAATEGLFVEAAAAVSIAAAESLVRAGAIGAWESVVCLLTSTALKDPAAARPLLPNVPLVDPSRVPAHDIIDDLSRREPGP